MIDKYLYFIQKVKEHDNFNKLFQYYKSDFYLFILVEQLNQIKNNFLSIDALIKINNVQDAYSIYRKLLETFFIIMSVRNNPKCAVKFVEHNKLIRDKLLDSDYKKTRRIRYEHIGNYLEYGYLPNYVDDPNNKLTMHDVAKAGNVLDFFNQYKMCNNFVHNNLNLVKFDDKDATKTLKEALDSTINYLIKSFNDILK